MTPNQQKFADEYIRTGNAKQSYMKVYKSCKKETTAGANASRTLDNASVKKYIAERMESKDKKRIASQDEILEYYTRVMRGEEKESQPFISPSGDLIENDVKPTLKERTKAADALAKRYGINKPVEEDKTDKINEGLKALADIIKVAKPNRDIGDFE